MKHKLLFVLPLLSCFVYFACRKNENPVFNLKPQDPFVVSATEYLKTQMNNEDFAKLDFDRISLLFDSNKTIGAHIFTKDKSINKFIFLSKGEKGYIGNWVEYLKLNGDSRLDADGIIKTKSIDGTFISELTYINNKPVKYVKTVNDETKITIVKYPKNNSLNSGNPITTAFRLGVQMNELNGGTVTYLPPVTVTAYINNSA